MGSWWMDFTGESLEKESLKGTDRGFPKEGIGAMGRHFLRGFGGPGPLENMAGCRSMLRFKKFLLQRDLALVCPCNEEAEMVC